MAKENCIHYTGKKLCLLGNICEGDMPCFITTSTETPILIPGVCAWCGMKDENMRPNQKYCSKKCKDRAYNTVSRARIKRVDQ